jgi:hypothetical protein
VMHHNRITGAQALAKNLRAEGQTSRADYVEELMNECLRLRQGLWDVAGICGADRDGNDTPAPLISDIVSFATDAARDLRASYDEAIAEEAA